jgi:hypothetical protein
MHVVFPRRSSAISPNAPGPSPVVECVQQSAPARCGGVSPLHRLIRLLQGCLVLGDAVSAWRDSVRKSRVCLARSTLWPPAAERGSATQQQKGLADNARSLVSRIVLCVMQSLCGSPATRSVAQSNLLRCACGRLLRAALRVPQKM